tara:strand:+ start:1970 stop:3325 length:1356 start_codon:yes stop_codon:yes gene_type:complete
MSDISFNQLVRLAELFHPETFYDETSWIDLGKILYYHQMNYFKLVNNDLLFDVWVNISKKTPGFEKTALNDCTIEWKEFHNNHFSIINDKRYNLDALKEYVKMDNPEGYELWEKDTIDNEYMEVKEKQRRYKELFDNFRKDCFIEHLLYTKALTIDIIYNHYTKWRKTTEKIPKKTIQEFMVDNYGTIQYCKYTYDFGWTGISLKEVTEEVTKEPLVLDITEPVDNKKVKFNLPLPKKYKSIFTDYTYDLMEKQPCSPGPYSPIPGGKGLNITDYCDIETNDKKAVIYKTCNNTLNDYSDHDSDYLNEEDFLGTTEESEILINDIKFVKSTKEKGMIGKKDIKEKDVIKRKGITKEKKSGIFDKLHKSSVKKLVKSYIKHVTEKCDDGYISLELLKEDYGKYCYYRGIPREQYFEKYVKSVLGKPVSIYIDGQYYENLFWGYKFKPIINVD